MSWSPNLDFSDDLKITFDQYEAENDYGLNRRSLRPGKTPLDVRECDDEIGDTPDAMVELKLQAYCRKLGVAMKTEKNRWPDAETEDDSAVEMEISKIIRDSGSDREPRKNPLNSKTTSKTATPLDKYPVAGVKGLYLTADDFKFKNVYFHSPKKDEENVKENGNCSAGTGSGDSSAGTGSGDCSTGTGNGNCSTANTDTAQRKQFIRPKMGVAGEKYVSPTELYAMKSRRNR